MGLEMFVLRIQELEKAKQTLGLESARLRKRVLLVFYLGLGTYRGEHREGRKM